MHRIRYKHWKRDDVIYEVQGTILHDNPESERIVVKLENEHYEDIIKTTIIEIEEIVND